MSKARIATEWLMVCSGCEISLLDVDEAIIDILAKADIVRSPVLADVKEFVPADVGIVTGGIRNEHNIHVAKEMRAHCDWRKSSYSAPLLINLCVLLKL